MHLILVGLSHAVAGIDLRERAAVGGDQLPLALRLLDARPELAGSMVLSTCSRTEVYATGAHVAAMAAAIRGSLRELHPDGYPRYADRLYTKTDEEAAGHLFRVATGIDSLLVGESQVLGQLRGAVGAARRHGRLDAFLDGTADRAVAAARRARQLTAIGRGAVSIGHAAAAHVTETLGPGSGPRVLVVGAGEAGELAVRMLRKAGAEVLVASRTGVTARALARRYGGDQVPLSRLPGMLGEIDVLVCSSSSRERLVTMDLLAPAAARRERPLVILDLALPRNVEPAAAGLPQVRYLDVDALSSRVAAAREGRRDTIEAASEVLEAELARWRLWRRTAVTAPTLAGITSYAEEVRAHELERAMRGLEGAEPIVARRMEALSRSLISKLLVHPISYLRSNPQDRAAAEALERIFRDGTAPPAAGPAPD
ncbi:MAG: glutamyl-tRNA reductase [Candidatus Dormibacteraceae bacterium]